MVGRENDLNETESQSEIGVERGRTVTGSEAEIVYNIAPVSHAEVKLLPGVKSEVRSLDLFCTSLGENIPLERKVSLKESHDSFE